MGLLDARNADFDTDVEQAENRSRLSTRNLMDLKAQIHQKLMEDIKPAELSKIDRHAMGREVSRVMTSVVADGGMSLPLKIREQVAADVVDEVLGYGPIQLLLDDPGITEIMVNGPSQVYAERGGKVYLTERVFRDEAHVMRIIQKIVTPLGRRVDESSPMVDARLPDGSRVNAIIPPLAVKGPTLTIRKFSREPYVMKDLVNFGTLTQQMADFLTACVGAKLNMIVSGGTGSGKTTTLNVLSSFVSDDERVITIEDAAELKLQQAHVVGLESRPPNIEGKGEVPIRMLVRNALRMRPDRIIVGEVRGGEALDMLQAMNTGHDGSLSTAHTNSPRDTLSRLETMALMAGTELPSRAIREQIASAIHLIVHQNRLRDGSRKISHITEVQGMEGDVITLQDIFLYEQEGLDEHGRVVGHHRATGLRPKFMDRLLQQGVKLPSSIFSSGARL